MADVPPMFGGQVGNMDDLSNRDLSQVPNEALTPAEREELKRRLDGFVEAIRQGMFEGRRATSDPECDSEKAPPKQGGES